MDEYPASGYGVYETTTCLKNEFTSKMKEVEQIFKKLADVTKSHDQTKQELRTTLCKTCRKTSYSIFKSPLKSFADNGCQTTYPLLHTGSFSDDRRDLIMNSGVNTSRTGETIEKIQNLIDELQKENKSLKQDLRTRDIVIISLREEKEEQTLKIEKLTEENKCAEKSLQELRALLKQAENRTLPDTQDHSSNKQSQLIDRLQQEKSILEQNIDQLNVQVGNLKAELKMKRTENELLLSKKVALPGLLDKQWRFEPRFDKEYLQSVQREIEHYWPLRDQGVTEDTLQHVNILFIGPVGAGKSSFINTVDSSLRGHVTVTAGAGNRHQSFTSAMRKYTMNASDNRRQLMFQLCDCRGLQDGVDITQDIESILEGHIPNNYVINPASPLKENMHGYNKHPGLEHKIHCVVYVLDAEKHSDHADIHTPFTTEDVRNQIINIQTHVDKKGIPQLILLNKVDIVCESTMQTTSDVYRSSLIRQRCIDAAEFLGLPPMTVLPMRNYFMETSTTDDIGILALYNTRQMLREADTFLRVNHLEELRANKYEPL
ncbi:interferon-induced protein 44-like [Argopecten irradians]|uniref:interferon-induced protein 44-like n=1 Tax=Argopecten irradians TaxID=31199 RepID=UPI003724089A